MLDDVFWPRKWSGTKKTSNARLPEHMIDLTMGKSKREKAFMERQAAYIAKQVEGATGAQMDAVNVRERLEGYCMS